MTVLDKKKILTQFAQLDLYVNELILDQENLNSLLNSILKAQNNILDKTAYKNCIKKIEQLNAKTEQQIDALCDLKDRILTAINGLDDYAERAVLWLHYIGKTKNNRYNRLNFWQIGSELNYSEIRIKQIHKSALEKLRL